MDEYIRREDAIKHLRGACIAKYPLSFSFGIFASADEISKFPTADVVAKSEVEELKAIIADHKANEERWQELYADTVDKWEKAYEELEIKLENEKAEVTREIFEDIERLSKILQNDYRSDNSEAAEWVEYATDYFLYELKKKYTEEKS